MGLFKSKAERWFEEGRNLIYRQGNIQKGLELLEQAANQEFAPAMLMLAEMYHTGQVRDGGERTVYPVDKNEARALELYQKLPDCPPVLFRRAEIFFHGNGVPRDDAKTLQLFRELQSRANEKENRKLFDLLGIMRLWRNDISGETLARDADAYVAAMQFWGRGGLEEDSEKAYDVLEQYMDSHEAAGTADSDICFCWEVLRYRRNGQAYLMDVGRLERLTWGIYVQTSDEEIRRILKEEMLVPSLNKMFAEEIREGVLSRAKDCVSMMTAVCKEDEALQEQTEEFLFGILEEETDRFATNEDYEKLIELLEQCSIDFDSIRMSCHLIDFYVSHHVTITKTSQGKEEQTTVQFDDSTREVMFRLCEQLERLKEGNTVLKEKFNRASRVKLCLYSYDVKLKELSPDAFGRLYQLSNDIQAEWMEAYRVKNIYNETAIVKEMTTCRN